MGSCVEPEEELPPVGKETKTVKLTKANCGLTSEDSTSEQTLSLSVTGSEEKYEFTIGPNCYAHEEYEEFLIRKDGYIKSRSKYHVDRLIVDYFSKKGINFEVLDASNKQVSAHESSVPTEFPKPEDSGAVLEYPINGSSWTIRNVSEFKPAFYSLTVVFTL